jgi:hypothetical protein
VVETELNFILDYLSGVEDAPLGVNNGLRGLESKSEQLSSGVPLHWSSHGQSSCQLELLSNEEVEVSLEVLSIHCDVKLHILEWLVI